MKQRKIIGWIMLFFPLGLYYMHTYSDWSKKKQYLISSAFGLIVLSALLTGSMYIVGMLLGISLFFTSVALLARNFLRKRSMNQSIVLVLFSIFLYGFSANQIDSVESEVNVADQQATYAEETELEKEEESEEQAKRQFAEAVRAVERAEEKETSSSLETAYDLVDQLEGDQSDLLIRLDIVSEIVESRALFENFLDDLNQAEESPTRHRLTQLEENIAELEEVDEEIIERVERISEAVMQEEESIAAAEEAVILAESTPSRKNYETAVSAVATLSAPKKSLTNRIEAVESEVIVLEEQAEAERKKAEAKEAEKAQAAEEARIQQEVRDEEARVAEQKKEQEEANRQAAEKAAASSSPAPSSSEPASAPGQTGEQALLNFINNASQIELQSISYIGPKRATYIVEYRQANGPFTHPGQITNVNQIGPGIYGNLRERFNLN